MVTKAERDNAERTTRVEERTSILLWIVGILFTFLIAEAVQLYLLSGRVSGVEVDIRYIRTAVDEVRLRQNALAPSDPQNIKEASLILEGARAKGIKLSQSVLQSTGNSFLAVSQKDPEAWAVAEQYLGYRSFLNLDFEPKLTVASGNSKYQPSVTSLPSPNRPGMERAYSVAFAGGYAPPERSARLESLDKPQPAGSEFAFFIIDGGADTIALDGAYMKNVIIRDSEIAYSGGPVRLENVYFVNCTFRSDFRVTPKTLELGTRILAGVTTTFDGRDKNAGS